MLHLIAGLLVAGAMKVAAPVLAPAALALLLYLLLAPLVEGLVRLRVPRGLAATLVIIAVCVPVGLGIERLAGPAEDWLRNAPADLRELRADLAGLSGTLARFRSASEAVDGVVDVLMPDELDAPPTVQVRQPGLLEVVAARVPSILVTVALSVALCLLLLVGGRRPLLQTVFWSPRFGTRRTAVRAARRIERGVSRYLGTLLVINVALGTAASLVFAAAGLPNPVLWGTIAGLFNFAPYVGPATTTAVVAAVGLTTMDGLAASLAPALGYLALTTIEGQFITPLVLGSRFAITPAGALFAVVVMGWLWGGTGALVAVPLLVSARIVYRALHPGAPGVALAPRSSD